MRILDLSQTIEPDMSLFPGTAAPLAEPAAQLAENGYNEHRLTLTTHTGTHMDAPAHLLQDGLTLDRLDVNHFCGPAVVLDARALGAPIGLQALLDMAGDIRAADFLLVATGWDAKWKTSAYLAGFPVLTREAARWLAGQNMKGVGVDAISVDPVDSSELPVHHALLDAGLVLVENLRGLTRLPPSGFTFCCLPLPVAHADGAPARAVAMLPG